MLAPVRRSVGQATSTSVDDLEGWEAPLTLRAGIVQAASTASAAVSMSAKERRAGELIQKGAGSVGRACTGSVNAADRAQMASVALLSVTELLALERAADNHRFVGARYRVGRATRLWPEPGTPTVSTSATPTTGANAARHFLVGSMGVSGRDDSGEAAGS